jgi:hypothetical protein
MAAISCYSGLNAPGYNGRGNLQSFKEKINSAYNRKIQVKSEVNKGAEFIISLPKQDG